MTLEFDKQNQLIIVPSPQSELTCQDLVNGVREWTEEMENLEVPTFMYASGKEFLGGGQSVGITVKLIDWKVKFADRSGPSWEVCDINGGNVVGVTVSGGNEVESVVIEPTTYITVTKTSSASSTVNELGAIQFSSFGGGVTVDVTNGTAGTTFPIGTPETPVNNLSDAKSIANTRGLEKLFIRGNITFIATDNIDGFEIIGQNPQKTTITLVLGLSTEGCEFRDATITGTLDGDTWIKESVIGELTYIQGQIESSTLTDVIMLSGSQPVRLISCRDGVPGIDDLPKIDMGGGGRDLIVSDYDGTLVVSQLSQADTVEISIGRGHVHLKDTITNGLFILNGIATLDDESTNTTIMKDGLMNRELISSTTWESVWVNTVNGTSGTTFPQGTKAAPVDNMSDALLIAEANTIETFHLHGDITLSGYDYGDLSFISHSPDETLVTIDVTSNLDSSYFEGCELTGSQNGRVIARECRLTDVTTMEGEYVDCIINSDLHFKSGVWSYLWGGQSTGYDMWEIDMNDDARVGITRTTLVCKVVNMGQATSELLKHGQGLVMVDNTCIAGNIRIGGEASHTGEGGGVTILDDTTRWVVWEEEVGNHTAAGTAGQVLQRDAYEGMVWLDTSTGQSGTEYPVGTQFSPSDNITDARAIAVTLGTKMIHVDGSISLNDNFDAWQFVGSNRADTVIDLNSQSVAQTTFEGVKLQGTCNGFINGSNITTGALTNLQGFIVDSFITANITIQGLGIALFRDCQSTTPFTVTIDMNIWGMCAFTGASSGVYNVTNMTNDLALFGAEGACEVALHSSCTAGTVRVGGWCDLIDNSTSMTSLQNAAVWHKNWEVVLTDYATSNMAGYKLQEVWEAINDIEPATVSISGMIADLNDITVADIWSEPQAGYTTTGTVGYNLDAPISTVGGGSITVSGIVDGVWDAQESVHTTTGSFGVALKGLRDADINKKVLTKISDDEYVEELYDDAGTLVTRTVRLLRSGLVSTREVV